MSPLGVSETEVVGRRCSIKKIFLKISQNSQKNTCANVSFLIKLQACEFCKIFKSSLFQRTPSMAASAETITEATIALNEHSLILQVFC